MSFEIFIPIYFLIVFLGSLAVTGWYFITRGEKKLKEDGSYKITGKVFRGWYFFWTREKKEKKKVWLDAAHMLELYMKIKEQFKVATEQYNLTLHGNTFTIREYEKYTEEISYIQNAYGVKFKAHSKFTNAEKYYGVYKEYENFVFPYWLRDPLAVCATCFSSLYGTIYYWIAVSLPKQNLFAWASSPVLASICFWIGFCFSLSVINTALAKRFN